MLMSQNMHCATLCIFIVIYYISKIPLYENEKFKNSNYNYINFSYFISIIYI